MPLNPVLIFLTKMLCPEDPVIKFLETMPPPLTLFPPLMFQELIKRMGLSLETTKALSPGAENCDPI